MDRIVVNYDDLTTKKGVLTELLVLTSLAAIPWTKRGMTLQKC